MRDIYGLRQYSRQVEELSDEIGEVADEVDEKWFGESGVVSKPRGRWADKTADETDERRADEYNNEWHDAFDDIWRNDVLQSDLIELLKHPIQHLYTMLCKFATLINVQLHCNSLQGTDVNWSHFVIQV